MPIRIALHFGLITGLAVFLLAWNYVGTLKTVYLEVNGDTSAHQTRYVQVGDILSEAGVGLGPFDTVEPHLGRIARSGETIRVTRAIPGAVTNDGAAKGLRTTLPIYVHNREFVDEVQTTETTVKGALATAGVELRTGDLVYPSLSAPIRAGQHIYLKRATEIRLRSDGQEHIQYTFAGTVDQLLKEAGVRLLGADRVEPPGKATVQEGLRITVVRVNEERAVQDIALPYTTEYVADNTLEFGEQSVQAGAAGLLQRQVRIMYENGNEVKRIVEKEWVERASQPAVVHYGTKIVLRTASTANGVIEYWRKMRVWATYYTPASSGKPTGHPAYGITRLGLVAKKGIIAVDPTVIPFYTKLYVPGYGIGVAVDTGGAIKGNWIDLAFSDDEEPTWATGWVDIYFLGPGPDPSEIRPPTS